VQAEAPPPAKPEAKRRIALHDVAEKESRPQPPQRRAAAKAADMKADDRFAVPPPPRADKNEESFRQKDQDSVKKLVGGKLEARDHAADGLDRLSTEGARGGRGAASGAGAPPPAPVASNAAPAPPQPAPLAKTQSRAEPKGYADAEKAPRPREAARPMAPAAAPPPPPATASAPAPRPPAPAPRPSAQPSYARKPSAAPAEPAGDEAAELDRAPAKQKKRELSDDELSVEELVQRADRAFAQQRWSEAADHYRALVRRFPGDVRVKTWSGRLRAAEQALGR
jgi:hypothetical protein